MITLGEPVTLLIGTDTVLFAGSLLVSYTNTNLVGSYENSSFADPINKLLFFIKLFIAEIRQ